MKKKICLIFMALFLIGTTPSKAVDIQTLLSQIGFNVFAQKDAKTEITKVIEKQQKYANKKNYKKLKELYSSTYSNNDGITFEDYIESLKTTADLHAKMTYNTTINSINVSGNYATVEAVDTAEGTTKTGYENIEGKGILTSNAKAIYYFKKENGDWKIDSEYVYSEKTALKYGVTKEIEINLDAPECIKAGTEYNIKISANLPEGSGLIASIATETIQYPHTKAEDIFRPMKNDGELERVVTSNTEGKNEIAFASVGIAKAVLNSEAKIDFVINGVAFISSRVNVIPNKVKANE